MDAWHPKEGATDGRLKFSATSGADSSRHVLVPCGRCVGCRARRASDWAVRACHEAQMHGGVACFVTRTFDDEHLPPDWSVRKETHQAFMKRLWRQLGFWPRNLSCGEYGEQYKRPHYHDILFGVDFIEDREPVRRSKTGGMLYSSPRLSAAWPYGEASFSEFNYDTAYYVAKYNVKQVWQRGDGWQEGLKRWDSRTGEVWQVEPPFLLMSRMPGLGAAWFERYRRDAFPSDFVTIDGRKFPVPAYYLRLLEKAGEEDLVEQVRGARRAAGADHAADRTERRLMTLHQAAILRSERFARDVA